MHFGTSSIFYVTSIHHDHEPRPFWLRYTHAILFCVVTRMPFKNTQRNNYAPFTFCIAEKQSVIYWATNYHKIPSFLVTRGSSLALNLAESNNINIQTTLRFSWPFCLSVYLCFYFTPASDESRYPRLVCLGLGLFRGANLIAANFT